MPPPCAQPSHICVEAHPSPSLPPTNTPCCYRHAPSRPLVSCSIPLPPTILPPLPGNSNVFTTGAPDLAGRLGSSSTFLRVRFDFGTLVHMAVGSCFTVVVNSEGECALGAPPAVQTSCIPFSMLAPSPCIPSHHTTRHAANASAMQDPSPCILHTSPNASPSTPPHASPMLPCSGQYRLVACG
jgi:hypothetical protein